MFSVFMKVLILGYSSFAKKTVIPALLKHSKFELVGVASKSGSGEIVTFNDYGEAIKKSECDVVYISLANSLHKKWILESLLFGKSVIVDKPGVLNGSEALECVRKAGKKLLIYESLPYLFYKKQKIGNLSFINANFGFPELPKDNFRNFKKFGGGAVNDLGPYLVATGEYYFGGYPKKIYSTGSFKKRAVILDYGNDKILSGAIGFGLKYQNKLELWGENYYRKLERAFSFPEADSLDAFKNMLDDFCKVYKSGDYKKNNEVFFKRASVLGEINHD